MATYDFTSMYTILPLQDLKETLGYLLQKPTQASNLKRARILVLRQDGTLEWIAAGRQSEIDT